MSIETWLKDHPAISCNWIEKTLNITTGTLRKGKPIPEQYKADIIKLLNNYGLNTLQEAAPQISPEHVEHKRDINNTDVYTIVRSWPELNGKRANFVNGDKWQKIN